MKKRTPKNKISLITFLFLIYSTILFLPRLISSLTKSDYFNGDFAFYYFLTKDIVINHDLPLLGHVVGEIGGFAQGPLWSYLLVPFFIIFNGDPIGGKLFMLLTSLVIYFTGVLFAWKKLGKLEGISTAFFLGSSPYLIKWTNLAWPPYIVPLLMILYFLFLYLFLSKKENKYFYASSLSLSLMAHFEIASLGLLLPSFIIILFYFVYRKLLNLKSTTTSLIIFSISFIPHLIYDLTHNFYNTRGFLSILFGTKNSESYPILLALQDRLHLIKTDLSAVFSIHDFRILLIIFVFLIFGTYLYIKDRKIKIWKKIFIANFLVIICTTFIGLILIPVERASFWWITYLTITYIFFSGIILGYMFRRNILFKLIISLIFLISIYSFFQNTNSLINIYQQYKNLKNEIRIQDPIEYVYFDSKNQAFNVIFLTGGEKIIDYKYMFSQTEKKHNTYFYPTNINPSFTSGGGKPTYIKEIRQFDNLSSGIYYIIISNRSIESGYAKRILDRNNFGEIIYTKRIHDEEGFTIQKRILD